jgi:gliding motility-associated-like protein
MKKIALFSILFLVSNVVVSQNLLLDGSFEATTHTEYVYPWDGMPFFTHWYTANYINADSNQLGTPDLYDDNFPFPETIPLIFNNIRRLASEGEKYIGLYCEFRYEGYLTPEAVGAKLTQTLEVRERYHIEIDTRNKGVWNYSRPPEFCVTRSEKHLEILFGADTVFTYLDEGNKSSTTNASRQFPLYSEVLETRLDGSWTSLGTCFEADGEESFFAVSMPIGHFGVESPCFIREEHWDMFYGFYFDIDNIRLTKLPDALQATATICGGRRTPIDIDSLTNVPTMQDEILYHWENGVIDHINYISEGGTYQIDAQVDCGFIPITLEVEEVKCDPDIFVPNAFTPNYDGHNDELETFIVVDLPIMSYQFSVFDRWGTMVFTTKNSDLSWDGRFRGQNVEESVYVWLLEYTINDIELGITNYKASGDVTVIR